MNMEPLTNDVQKLQRAMDFGTRMIPLVLKLRKARDSKAGVSLSAEEVVSLIEVLHVLRQGPESKGGRTIPS